jgi:ribonuclease BN (tRNA processing enzyme)
LSPGDAVEPRLSVTVLGSSCSIPRPGRACSSYLIEGAGQAIVADLGTGGLANLRHYREPEMLDAVVISHMHADHFIDVIPMRYALKYGNRSHDRRVPLLLPPGGESMLRHIVSAFVRESAFDFLEEVFEVQEYDPAAPLRLGEATLRFAPTVHFIPTYALRCDLDGRSVVYSADTAPHSEIAALARGCSLFLCEATLGASERGDSSPRGHLSAMEAARLAAAAETSKLVLTHYPASIDAAELRACAAPHFAGEIAVADDNDSWQI